MYFLFYSLYSATFAFNFMVLKTVPSCFSICCLLIKKKKKVVGAHICKSGENWQQLHLLKGKKKA